MVRRSSGQSSETSAAPTDHSPPMPTPARNRKIARVHTPVENAASKVKNEKQKMLNIMVRTRPNRSAMGPQMRANPYPIMNSAKKSPPKYPTLAAVAGIPDLGRSSFNAGTSTSE